MKIHIAGVAEGQELRFSEDWDAQTCDLDAPGLRYATPLHVEVLVRRDIGIIVAGITVAAGAVGVCSRCCRSFDIPFKREFRLAYSVSAEENEIDIGQNVREELLLGLAQKLLCRPDCKGLCPKCGTDLNEGRCSCLKSAMDHS